MYWASYKQETDEVVEREAVVRKYMLSKQKIERNALGLTPTAQNAMALRTGLKKAHCSRSVSGVQIQGGKSLNAVGVIMVEDYSELSSGGMAALSGPREGEYVVILHEALPYHIAFLRCFFGCSVQALECQLRTSHHDNRARVCDACLEAASTLFTTHSSKTHRFPANG